MFIGVEPAALSYLTMQIDLTHSHLSFFHHLMLLSDIYYRGIHILTPSITSTEHKGRTHTTALTRL